MSEENKFMNRGGMWIRWYRNKDITYRARYFFYEDRLMIVGNTINVSL